MFFVYRLITQLRKVTMTAGFPHDPVARLATCLEYVRALPPERRNRSLTLKGDDDEDRLATAHWLYECAHAPAHCAPPWTRGFSEIMAWVLRHNHPVTDDGVARLAR